MGNIIGFGGWSVYYNYLLGSIISKIVKDDLLGFGNDSQLLNNLIISKHCFLVLLLGYCSDFLFGGLIMIYLYLKEKNSIKKRQELENIETKNIIQKSNELELTRNSINADDDEKSKDDDFKAKLSKHIMNKNITKKHNKKNDTKINDSTDPNITGYNKYELIHNDIYENIVDNSRKYIIISSILLILKDILEKVIFKNNDIFNYFFINILIITLIYKYYFKEKIYKHQGLALIIILIVSGAFLVSCMFNTTNNINKNGYQTSSPIFEIFSGQYYMIFLLILISIFISICLSIGLIIQKRIMDYKFITPYKLILYKGIIGLFIIIIIIIISTNVYCSEINEDSSNNKNNTYNESMNYNNISDIKFLMKENDISSTTQFEFLYCDDIYNNKTYYDNFFSYITNITKFDNDKNQKYIEMFLSIPLYIIFNFVASITLLLVNKYLSPIHCLIQDSIYNIIHIPVQYSAQNFFNRSNTSENDYNSSSSNANLIFMTLDTRILKIISYSVSFIGYCIYLEIIELKFCGLNKNIKKNIRKRADEDGKVIKDAGSERTDSTYSNYSSDDSDENSMRNKFI